MEEERHDLGAFPGGGEEVKGEQEQKMELGQALGTGVGAEETPANSNACCICHEPWASCGAHRICCIPCGHVYGRSCLEMFLIRSGCTAAKCLWCEKQFKREDIVNLYGTTEHVWDDYHHDQVAELARERAELARGRAELARERVEIALQRVDTARRIEDARRVAGTQRAAEVNEAADVFVFIILLILILIFIVALLFYAIL